MRFPLPALRRFIASAPLKVYLASLILLGAVAGCGGSSRSDTDSSERMGRIVFVGRYGSGSAIMTINPDGSERKVVSKRFGFNLVQSAEFAPDGTRIVFQADVADDATPFNYHPRIWVMDADGENMKAITGSGSYYGIQFSKDGSKILFSKFENDAITLYSMNWEGGELVTIAQGLENHPIITPDGTKMIVSESRNVGPATFQDDVYLMNLDGSNKSLLLADATGATYSRDGSRITFTRNYDIYIANSDGSGQRNLTDNPHDDSRSSFSPDGNKIVFNTDRDGDHVSDYTLWPASLVYVMNTDGTDQRPVRTNKMATADYEETYLDPFDTASDDSWAPSLD